MIMFMMVQEELHEADVLWPDTDPRQTPAEPPPAASTAASDHRQKWSSTPIRILRPGGLRCIPTARGNDEEDSGGCAAEIVPPHVVVERRWCAEKMAYSVCTGQGRTLKGRDLRHVRNSVLRLTGFLER